MMRRILLPIGVLLLVIAVPALARASDTVTAEDLIENPGLFAGKEITLSGELIGDYGLRSDGTVWVQLNDDPYALMPLRAGGSLRGGNIGIALRSPAALIDGLDPPGRYGQIGPVVSVTGIWVFHDPHRGGETYLDVRALDVVRSGRVTREPVSPSAAGLGIVLLTAAAGLAGLLAYRGRSEK